LFINGHKYYFNPDAYTVTGWQVLPHPDTGKKCGFYIEPRAGQDLECALYLTDHDGV
jgi:hypothetical protein